VSPSPFARPSGPQILRSPESARAAYELGTQKLAAGDTVGAIATFHAALHYDPYHAPSMRGLGQAYAQRGEKANAAAAFEQYLRFAPNAADAAAIQKRIAELRGR
jgi:Flp pilus assembly protein TadD